jgi:carbon-monoxide dehydrogenase medium subunit
MSGFSYFEPETLDAAVALLAEYEESRCIAGGQTLVAMMNANLIEPTALIALRRIRGLDAITAESDGSISIGAMATHTAVSRDDRLAGGLAVIRQAATVIAHPAIRNLGTLGGAICHADPNSDYPAAIVAAEAEIETVGPGGTRSVPASEFFEGYMATALRPGELVTRVRVPKPPEGSVGLYEKFARVDGDYATVSVALILKRDGGICSFARIALGACAMTPVRVRAAEEALEGTDLGTAAIEAAASILAEACDPVDDVRGSAAYRLALVPRLLRRAVEKAR